MLRSFDAVRTTGSVDDVREVAKVPADADLMRRARSILASFRDQVPPMPPDTREWWVEYLRRNHDRYLDLLSFFDHISPSGRVLEIGCVPGHFTALLRSLEIDVQGVDIDPGRVENWWTRWEIPVHKVDVEQQELPFASETFDVVFFTEVIEHLRINPLYALREIHRVLKPGGHLILGTPNITPLHRIQFLLGKGYVASPAASFQELERLGHMGHVRLYSLEELAGLLAIPQFRIAYATRMGRVPRSWKVQLLMPFWGGAKAFRSHQYVVATK